VEDLDAELHIINSVLKTIRENVKISTKQSLGYYGLKGNKPWFAEEIIIIMKIIRSIESSPGAVVTRAKQNKWR
jgi:hypothetical protein